VGTQGGGVFKSTNFGGTWTEVNIGLANTSIQALAVDPLNAQVVYAGTGAGVFRSVDGAATWQPFSEGLNNTAIRALLVDPVASSTVYAATFGGGVFLRPAD
jgi:photosystem II stability/assembly factor-like uncharacterized protein